MAAPYDTASRVDAAVWIGGYRAAADPAFARRAGITHVVKLFADGAPGPDGPCPVVRHPGVRYFVAAAVDSPDYDIRRDAVAALRFLRAAAAGGGRVLVHCHAGISRSATVVLLYLMTRYGCRLDAALQALRAVRPVVRPNPGFMRWLRAVDARLAAARAGKLHTSIPPSD